MTATGTSSGELRAAGLFTHPLRVLVLELLADHGKLSPKQLSDLTGEPIGNVSYHVRALLDQGAVRNAGTKPARGALEHFYRLDEPKLARALHELWLVVVALRARLERNEARA